jgi:poly(3-hydroxybutyrate) depolymerase
MHAHQISGYIFAVAVSASSFVGAAHAAPLGGVYALCDSKSDTPIAHYQQGRATRTGSGSTATYFARGSGTQLTSTVTLSQTGKDYYEVLNSCPVPPNCVRSGIQPPSGLGLHCRFAVPNQGMRDYDMHVPNSYTNLTQVPVVLEMHGGGGAAEPPATELTSGWRDVSDSSVQPFLVVWPVGSNEAGGSYGAEWQTCNYDNSTVQKPCPATGYPNDRNFLIEVLKKVALDLKVDRRKVYAAGLSSGAAMVHTLACKYSEYFAAVAPMATGIQVSAQKRERDVFDIRTNCNPTRETPQFYVHSHHDQTSAYTEGAASVSYWRAKFGCTTASTQTYSSDIDVFDGSDLFYPGSWDLTSCRTTECSTTPMTSAVAFCDIDGSSNLLNAYGHIVWNGDDLYFPGVQPSAPRLAQWAWDWMRKYSLPASPSWPPPVF